MSPGEWAATEAAAAAWYEQQQHPSPTPEEEGWDDGRDPWEAFELTAGARALFLASDAEHESDGLTALAKLVELRRTVDSWIAQTVGRGRGQGATWEQLAEVLQVKRQAVWERYSKRPGPLAEMAKLGQKRAMAGEGFTPDA